MEVSGPSFVTVPSVSHLDTLRPFSLTDPRYYPVDLWTREQTYLTCKRTLTSTLVTSLSTLYTRGRHTPHTVSRVRPLMERDETGPTGSEWVTPVYQDPNTTLTTNSLNLRLRRVVKYPPRQFVDDFSWEVNQCHVGGTTNVIRPWFQTILLVPTREGYERVLFSLDVRIVNPGKRITEGSWCWKESLPFVLDFLLSYSSRVKVKGNKVVGRHFVNDL